MDRMQRTPNRPFEDWEGTYLREPEIYDSFSQSEDPDNRTFKKLLELVSLDHKAVLEIGCGSGRYTELLASVCEQLFALDISQPLLRLARKKCESSRTVQFLHCSAQNIPLPDRSVDLVFAGWVLSAMTSRAVRDRSMAEILRVLSDDGGVWLFENHHESEFMAMRGYPPEVTDFVEDYRFDVRATMKTDIRFPSLDEAKRVLGYIFRDRGLKYLDRTQDPRIGHKIDILHRPNRPL